MGVFRIASCCILHCIILHLIVLHCLVFQSNFAITMANPVFGRFHLRPPASISHEEAVLCLPPPYTGFPASESLTSDEAAMSVSLRCPHEAWPPTDDPRFHLPRYSVHPSFGEMPGVLPVVAWDKNDHPPTYEESCQDTTVIHM